MEANKPSHEHNLILNMKPAKDNNVAANSILLMVINFVFLKLMFRAKLPYSTKQDQLRQYQHEYGE
jgi:hypothetical protein